MSEPIRRYSDLQSLVLQTLRNEHPDWTEEMLAAYEARFHRLIALSLPGEASSSLIPFPGQLDSNSNVVP